MPRLLSLFSFIFTCIGGLLLAATLNIFRFLAAAPITLFPPDPSTRDFGGRLAYAGPDMDLRHEAGTSRRSAARNT